MTSRTYGKISSHRCVFLRFVSVIGNGVSRKPYVGFCERMVRIMNVKMEEILAALRKKEDEEQKNVVLWVLAIIGAVAAIVGIAYAVYRFFTPDYLEDFESDLDNDFEDYFEEETENDAEKAESGKEE